MSDKTTTETKDRTNSKELPRNQSKWQKPTLSFVGKLTVNVQGASGPYGDPGTGGVGKRPTQQ